MSEANKILNLVYHSAVLSGLAITYTMLGKSFLKMRPADLSKLDFEDTAKLIAIISASSVTKDFLVKQGILPENISV
jgi:hypothetical protein